MENEPAWIGVSMPISPALSSGRSWTSPPKTTSASLLTGEVIRAVIDTNVLVSGLLSPAGNEALILLAIHQGLVRPCFSQGILEEYAAVVARPKFAFPADEIEAVLAMLRSKGSSSCGCVSGHLCRPRRHQVSALR